MKLLNPDLYELVLSFMLSTVPATEHECLAEAIYFESRDQSSAGMIGVAQVILNRVSDSRFPDSICGTVRQGRLSDPLDAPVQIGKCQFSFYCDGEPEIIGDQVAWETSKRKAAHAFYLHDIGYDITEGSTHYHADTVSPVWAETLDHVTQIDDHIFYRWE